MVDQANLLVPQFLENVGILSNNILRVQIVFTLLLFLGEVDFLNFNDPVFLSAKQNAKQTGVDNLIDR